MRKGGGMPTHSAKAATKALRRDRSSPRHGQVVQREPGAFAPTFEFHHHDVFNYNFNPGPSKPRVLPFPEPDDSATLVNAFSVFTHLTQEEAPYYLGEVARVLTDRGAFHSTWFLFDKREFPPLQEGIDALYTSYVDPSAAVFFDRSWLRRCARAAGLVITKAKRPDVRGYQWILVMESPAKGVEEIELPPDRAPIG